MADKDVVERLRLWAYGDGPNAPLLKEIYAEITNLRSRLSSAEARVEEEKAKVAGYRDALETISTHIYCEGPGCIYCERDDHHPSAAAKIAQKALSPEQPNGVERVIKAAEMVVKCHGDNKSIFDLSQALSALSGDTKP